MGYYVSMDFADVVVPADKVDDCLKAINALHDDKQPNHYGWVRFREGGFKTLKKAFEAWRYDANFDDLGNLHIEYFTGEKLGDDEFFWESIAAHIESGACIDCQGEDRDFWLWDFQEGVCFNRTGKVVYDD